MENKYDKEGKLIHNFWVDTLVGWFILVIGTTVVLTPIVSFPVWLYLFYKATQRDRIRKRLGMEPNKYS